MPRKVTRPVPPPPPPRPPPPPPPPAPLADLAPDGRCRAGDHDLGPLTAQQEGTAQGCARGCGTIRWRQHGGYVNYRRPDGIAEAAARAARRPAGARGEFAGLDVPRLSAAVAVLEAVISAARAELHDAVIRDSRADDPAAHLSGPLFVAVTYGDGTSGNLYPEIAPDSRWRLEVPEGAVTVAGLRVRPGDTVSGTVTVT